MKNFKQKVAEKVLRKEPTKRLVDDYMTKDLVTFSPDTDLEEVVHKLISKRISGAPVLDDDGKVVGLIDDKDCLRLAFDSLYHRFPANKKTVKDYMTNVMKSVKTGTDIYEVANIFMTTPFKRLVVLDQRGSLKGQISRRDVLIAIQDSQHWR